MTRDVIPRWLIPSLLYTLMVGSLGVTTKLALEDRTWPEIVLWATVGYGVIAAGILALGRARVAVAARSVYGACSGALAAGSLIVLFLALDAGDVSRVVPVTSAYPVVTLVLAPALLAERLTADRVGATLLVIVGVILISLD